MLSVFFIAFSLALDAFAISVSCGMSVQGHCVRQALRVGLWFGAFQFGMPLIGWLLGNSVSDYIGSFDRVIAFVMLCLIGGFMIWEGARGKQESVDVSGLSHGRLAMLAVATSIDAFAVGVPLAFMDVNILLSALIIGGVAFTLSFFGGFLGRRLGAMFHKWAVLAGGLVLITIGLKMLAEYVIMTGPPI